MFRSGRQSPASGSIGGLYFRSDEAAALRRRFESAPHRAERWRLLLANADSLVGKPAVSGPVDIGRTRPALGNAGITAFAYALTGERRYADRALREANALLGETQWTKPAPNNRGANLGTGEASTACALVYDWCRAAMTDTDRASFRDRLWKLGIQPYVDAIGPLKDWWRDNDVTNWTGVVNGGCGLAALAILDDRPEARPVAEHAWERIVAFLKTANRADGGGDEGVMYYTYGMLFANYFAVAAARRFGNDRGVFRDAVDKMAGYWLVGMQGADNRYANFNDMGDDTFADLPPRNPEGGPNAALCALWESRTPGGDRLLAWAADHGGDNWYWRGASPFSLLFRSDSPPVRTRPAFQKSALFRESGQTVWRSEGKGDTPGLWFAFNGGWTSDRSHYNLDLGSFVLTVGGERLIWDPGYGKVRTGDHSSLLIDGQEQVKNVSGVYRAWAEGDGCRWLACDLSAVYGKNAPVLTRWVRHAILLEDGASSPALILLDDLAASRPTNWETRLQVKGVPLLGDAASPWATIGTPKASLNVLWASSEGAPKTALGKEASLYLNASLTGKSNVLLATALFPLLGDRQKEQPKLVLTKSQTGATLTLTHGQKRQLAFSLVSGGGLRLVTVDGKPAPSAPGPEKRSLRRV